LTPKRAAGTADVVSSAPRSPVFFPSMIDITPSANPSRRRRRFASSSSSPDARASAPRADARMRAMRTVAPARPRPALAFARPTSARDANARRPNVLVGSTARMTVARGSL